MGTYKIAPDGPTGEIGMAQMKYGLVNKDDYNNSQGVTTEINMQTLCVSSTTYQSDLTSKTWDTSQPFGFGEMYGQTWQDVILATVSFTLIPPTAGSMNVSIYKNTANNANLLYQQNNFTQTTNGTVTVTSGDKIICSGTANLLNDPYNILGEYRVPNSGNYTSWFFQSSGPSGGNVTFFRNFFVTPNTSTSAKFIIDCTQ